MDLSGAGTEPPPGREAAAAGGDEALVRGFRTLLPPAPSCKTPARARTLDSVSRAFRINLAALSLLALLVGAFLIYNTMSFSVAQRWNLLGALRGLGAEPGDIAWLIGREALVLSALGNRPRTSWRGMPAGPRAGGPGGPHLERPLFRRPCHRPPGGSPAAPQGRPCWAWAWASSPAWGPPGRPRASAPAPCSPARPRRPGCGAACPSLNLARRPGSALRPPGPLGRCRARARLPAWAAWRPASPPCSSPSSPGPCGRPLLRLISAAGAAVLGQSLPRVARGSAGTLARMAIRETGASLSRTGVAAAALMTALSVTVAMGIMVDSFRRAVRDWLEAILVADVYASAPREGTGRLQGRLDSAWVEAARRMPGVAGATGLPAPSS